MNQKEYTAVFSLALIMAVRMLGLFMILPVFSMHAAEFAGATPQLIGLALGAYGLTQGLLQIPLGLLSDRIGRRPVMSLGLAIFLLGSVWAALTHSIYGLILGRALQGSGAIGSTILAMISDVTRDENRSKAMAAVGLAVGASFSIAMALGPILNAWGGLNGIFWVTAWLAIVAELLVWAIIPNTPVIMKPAGLVKMSLIEVLKKPDLLRLNFSVFSLHAMLTALFIATPVILTNYLKLSSTAQTGLYLLILFLAFVFMLPCMILAEKKHRMKTVFVGAISALFLAQLLMWSNRQNLFMMGLLLLVFFTAFSLLEAVLPSWVSKLTPARCKGTAMGCYSSAQFLGIFVGGGLGGWVLAHFGMEGIFVIGASLALVWLGLAIHFAPPPNLTTVIFDLQQFSEKNLDALVPRLYDITGVIEVAVMQAEALIYMKIDQAIVNKLQLRQSLEKSKLVGIHSPQGGMPVGEHFNYLRGEN